MAAASASGAALTAVRQASERSACSLLEQKRGSDESLICKIEEAERVVGGFEEGSRDASCMESRAPCLVLDLYFPSREARRGLRIKSSQTLLPAMSMIKNVKLVVVGPQDVGKVGAALSPLCLHSDALMLARSPVAASLDICPLLLCYQLGSS